MGRFEELLKKAREGDTEALDTLEQEFSGTTLRSKAEEADRLKGIVDSQRDLAVEGKIGRLRQELPEDLRGMDLSANDFEGVDLDDLTIERLTEKAESKSEAVKGAQMAQAQEAGFDSVEDFQQALDAVKQAQAGKREGMEKITGAASGGGAPPDTGPPSEPFEAMKEGFDEAKERGLSDDRAMGEGVHSLLAAQAPAEE